MSIETNRETNPSGAKVERVEIADGELVYRPITVCSGDSAQQKIQATYSSQSIDLSVRLHPEEAADIAEILEGIVKIID